jgi:hypothetical protein
MDRDALASELFMLIGYLLTSAHGLYDEPAGYGPFRLVDTAGRLLGIMETHGLSDSFLRQLAPALNAQRFGPSSDDSLRAVLDELCLAYASKVRQRVSLQEEKT